MADWERLRGALAQVASEGKLLVVACKPEDHGSLLDFASAVGEPRGLGAVSATRTRPVSTSRLETAALSWARGITTSPGGASSGMAFLRSRGAERDATAPVRRRFTTPTR